MRPVSGPLMPSDESGGTVLVVSGLSFTVCAGVANAIEAA